MIGNLRVIGAGLAIAGVVVISGCGDSDDSDDSGDSGTTPTVDVADDNPSFDGHTFVATDVVGQTLVPETELTITFDDARLAVLAGCNTMAGGYTIPDDVLIVDRLAQTQMACEPERHAQDEWVALLIRNGPTVTRGVRTFTLTGDDDVKVTFEERSDPPTDPLDGSAWRIVSLEGPSGSLDAPEGAYLAYADGRVAVSTGCNSGSADVEITDDTITFGPMALTRMACEGDVMAFETALLELFGGPLEYTLESDELTLSNAESTLTLQQIP